MNKRWNKFGTILSLLTLGLVAGCPVAEPREIADARVFCVDVNGNTSEFFDTAVATAELALERGATREEAATDLAVGCCLGNPICPIQCTSCLTEVLNAVYPPDR